MVVENQERDVFGDGDRLRFSLAVDEIFDCLLGLSKVFWGSSKLNLVQLSNVSDCDIKLFVDVLEEGLALSHVLEDPFVPHLGLWGRKFDCCFNDGGDLLVDPLGKVFDLRAHRCHNDLGGHPVFEEQDLASRSFDESGGDVEVGPLSGL